MYIFMYITQKGTKCCINVFSDVHHYSHDNNVYYCEMKKNKCILGIDITTKVNKAISTLKNKFVPYLKNNLNRPKQVADTTQVVKENYKSDESFKKTGLAYTQEKDFLNYD